MWRKKKSLIILIAILFIGACFRFYKLDWGEGYFSHPDEYHIAGAVERLNFPSQMNPKLFSYGSFTVYLVYFSKLLFSTISGQQLAIHSILVGRFYSAFFSTLTIIVVYLISLKLLTNRFSLLAAVLCASLPGLIQQAHFATPESTLTFWLFLTLYFGLEWLEKRKISFLYLSAASLGIALGTKIVALTFLPILVLLPLFPSSPSEDEKSREDLIPLREVDCATASEVARPGTVLYLARQRPRLLRGEYWRKRLKTLQRWTNAILGGGCKIIKLIILPLLIVGLAFLLVFPYSLIDWPSFRSTTQYETGLGRGEPIVFYTRQFINTAPVLFQYQKILPYALGPAMVIFGTIGFLLMSIDVLPFLGQRHLRGGRSTPRMVEGFSANFTSEESPPVGGATIRGGFREKGKTFLILAFLFYFLPNAFLFAKWTRFIAPSLPFFAIFTAYLLSKIKNKALLTTNYLLLITCPIWTLMFFSIYLRPDVRIIATDWAVKNLPPNSVIFTEQGNMIEAPLEGSFKKTSLDFYGLEENPKSQQQLPKFLAQADYFIIQSRRIFINHQRLANQFPKTSRFYDLLFSDQLGFIKIKEFDSYPQLKIDSWRFAIPDEMAEETWSVFDHPVIRVYKKVTPLPERAYENLLKI